MNTAREFNDDLSDIFGAPLRTTPVEVPASYKPLDFSEPCRKCRGSGRFTSYSGRSLGACFACKGKGKNTFKTSPEQRTANRTNAQARKVRTAKENADAFAVEHADVAAWIIENTSFGFAVAMGEAVAKYGSLTENQLAAAKRCIASRVKAQAERVERVASAPTIEINRIEAAFASATASGLKRPRLRLAGFQFSPAKADSKNPGAVYVRGLSFDKSEEIYLGKIVAGKFLRVRECSVEREAEILAAAANPEAAAVAYGKLTGSCSCCGRPLENSESVARGIGPICATKYGWG